MGGVGVPPASPCVNFDISCSGRVTSILLDASIALCVLTVEHSISIILACAHFYFVVSTFKCEGKNSYHDLILNPRMKDEYEVSTSEGETQPTLMESIKRATRFNVPIRQRNCYDICYRIICMRRCLKFNRCVFRTETGDWDSGCVIEMFRLRLIRRCAVPVFLLLPTWMVESAGPQPKGSLPCRQYVPKAHMPVRRLWI